MVQRQDEGKLAPSAKLAFCRYFATEPAGNLFGEIKPQGCALLLLNVLGRDAAEGTEEPVQMLYSYADAGIPVRHLNAAVFFPRLYLPFLHEF